MAHKTAGLRGKLRLLTIIGFSLVLLVCGGIVALFLFDIEDVIYARGKIASEIAYDIIGHMDGRVIRLNFEEGDDVEAGEVIAQLDTILYDEQRVRIEAELREYEAELEVKKAELEALRTNPLPKELWYAETNLKESEDKARRTQARLNRSLQLSSSNAISRMPRSKTSKCRGSWPAPGRIWRRSRAGSANATLKRPNATSTSCAPRSRGARRS